MVGSRVECLHNRLTPTAEKKPRYVPSNNESLLFLKEEDVKGREQRDGGQNTVSIVGVLE
jgi:hypothetical protein